MANAHTITGLIADVYVAANQVARERVGAITSVMVNQGSEQASKDTTIRSIRSTAATVGTTITPAMTIPSTDDVTTTSDTLTLAEAFNVSMPILGETSAALNAIGGPGELTVRQAAIAERVRAIANAIEIKVCAALYKGASRATGTAGTTPFASNLNDASALARILDDNGCPDDGQRCLVLNSASVNNMRNLTNLQTVNTAGSAELLRRGTLLDLFGMMVKQSAGFRAHTKGTGASYLVDLVAGYAAGLKTIHVDTGTGTFVSGDVITVADEGGNKYVIKTGFAGDGDGDIVIHEPGLLNAIVNDKAVTIGNNYTPNVALHKSACELAIRPYFEPEMGDAAVERGIFADPVSGLSFSFSIYKGFKMNSLVFTGVYGVKVWKPEYVALLLG